MILPWQRIFVSIQVMINTLIFEIITNASANDSLYCMEIVHTDAWELSIEDLSQPSLTGGSTWISSNNSGTYNYTSYIGTVGNNGQALHMQMIAMEKPSMVCFQEFY